MRAFWKWEFHYEWFLVNVVIDFRNEGLLLLPRIKNKRENNSFPLDTMHLQVVFIPHIQTYL